MARQGKGRPRKVVRGDACFVPGPSTFAVCPHCWSLPSLRQRRDQELDRLDVTNEAVVCSVYPCSNDACQTHILIRFNIVSASYVEHSVTANTLSREAHKEFLAGQVKNGVWRDKHGVRKVSAPAPLTWEASRDGPWVYITCPALAPQYPTSWKVKDGAVKTLFASVKGQAILEWFRQRGVSIDPYSLKDPRYKPRRPTKKQLAAEARAAKARAKAEKEAARAADKAKRQKGAGKKSRQGSSKAVTPTTPSRRGTAPGTSRPVSPTGKKRNRKGKRRARIRAARNLDTGEGIER